MNDSGTWQLAVAIVLAASGAIATYVNIRLKADLSSLEARGQRTILEMSTGIEAKVSSKLDEMRREFQAVQGLGSQLEQRLSGKLDDFRREFSSAFVPASLASEQMKSVMYRLDQLDQEQRENRRYAETEINKNRERIHDSGRIWANIENEIHRHGEQLTDKARRMSGYEERERANQERLRDIEDSIEELRKRA